jgi:hypothetical protein
MASFGIWELDVDGSNPVFPAIFKNPSGHFVFNTIASHGLDLLGGMTFTLAFL